ncbi:MULTISPECIES: carboxymuconolactone decarboxylase family protein [Haloferax]|uniref:Carboxymuconolactone decarboxylase family protein n=1 Tax=Haloferax massiliensis TaxID=1476858 RepID=A0A0D6JRX4_9EURY|nr:MULTISPECIES: carboxymuconolactone decarboxylase family protein [Haloferax]CQR50335.1 Carboxymuconolactone decarboxylase family protein [Haloferax massiliensis]
MEGMLGQVPSWMENLAEPASEHSWGLFRDLNLGTDTELAAREKALIGVAVAAAINCPYCTYFHTEEARLSGVADAELKETVNLAADTKYFSTILHGNETDLDEFRTETDEIVEHIMEQQAAADD